MINHNNFVEYLINYFPEFFSSIEYKNIFPDGGFNETYLVSETFFDWYISQNKFLFFYKKKINKLFVFCNYIYKNSDNSVTELIKQTFFKKLIHKPFLKKIAFNNLDHLPKKDLKKVITDYRKKVFFKKNKSKI
jgi:hypothetical protein